MGIFSKKNSAEWRLLLEIGSGSVVAVIVNQQAELHERIWSKRIALPLKQNIQPGDVVKRLTVCLVELLMEVSNVLSKSGTLNFKDITIFYSAPWTYEETISNELTNNETFTITKSDTESLFASVTFNSNEKLVLLSQYHPQWSVNGYGIESPIGKDGTSLQITTRIIAVDEYIYRAINDSVSSLFTNTPTNQYSITTYHTFTIETLDKDISSTYGVIHLSYEACSFTIIENSVPIFYLWEGIGFNTIVRAIAHETNAPHEHIASQLQTFDLNQIDTEIPSKIIKTIHKDFSVFFEKVKSQVHLPRKIFICSQYPMNQQIQKFLQDAATGHSSMKYDFIDVFTLFPPKTKQEHVDGSVLMMTGFSTNLD